MEEVKSRDWTDKVYKPDIKEKWDLCGHDSGFESVDGSFLDKLAFVFSRT